MVRKRILFITPSYSGGSWVATEKIVKQLSFYADVTVVGLGKLTVRDKKINYKEIPYPKYEFWGEIHSKTPILALIWNLPLSIYFLLLFIFLRPNIVISNGFSTVLPFTPFIKLFRTRVVVLYHGVILGFMSPNTKKVVGFFSKFVDLVVVNSVGSKDDIKVVVNESKLIINEHFADDLFFKKIKRKKSSKLNILYVGSLNKEKLYSPLVEVAKKLNGNQNFTFTFIGRGKDQAEIIELSKKFKNFKYLGYIGERKKLKQIYDKSDVLWSYADETYLSLPATEALASGLPLIIPKYPGMFQKSNKKVYITKNIVPEDIGWLIDPSDIENCLKLIKRIQKYGISNDMKKKCINYANEKYSSKNLNYTIAKINNYL